ncbi:MAG: extracellular solute-binding protein [Anaerolineaceae bacterium]
MIRNSTMRILAVIVVACGLVLTSCGSPSPSLTPSPDLSATAVLAATASPSPTPSPTINPALSQDPAVLKGVKLAFIHPWSGSAGQAIEQITGEFNTKNIWGIRVELIAAGSSGEEFNLVTQALEQDGFPPAGVAAASPDHAAAWEKQKPGSVVDLTPFINDAEWGMKQEEVADYYPGIWNQTIHDGRQDGIPAQRSLQILVYNQTWAEELGFREIPATSGQFQQQVCAATQANLSEKIIEKRGTGGYILTTDPSTQLAWLAAFGFNLASLNEDKGYVFRSTEAEASYTFLRKLFDKSCSWLSKNPQPFEYFAGRQSLVYSASLTDLPGQEAAMKAAGSADHWTVIPFPGEDGISASLQTGLDYIILDSNPPEELASWVFMQWLMLPRHQAEMAEAGSSLPLSKSSMEALQDYGEQHPQWLTGTALLDTSVPAPIQPGWRMVKGVLEDAAWQLIQPTLQPIPEILQQLDETIPEVIN